MQHSRLNQKESEQLDADLKRRKRQQGVLFVVFDLDVLTSDSQKKTQTEVPDWIPS